MDSDRIEIELLPSPDEGAAGSADGRQVESALRQADPKLRKLVLLRKSLGQEAVDLGQYLVQFVGPAGIGALGSWLVARAGRKVRLKVDDVEVEARTPEEVDRLLRTAKQFRDDSAKRASDNSSSPT